MPFLLCAILLSAGLLAYSQTQAFAWDEGFHILAAQLIKAGRKPYLDFVFAQTPLNAYWNAAWMRLFGDSWRGVHAVAAVLTAAAVVLAADFVRTRFPISNWKQAGTLVTLALAGGNAKVVAFGPLAQAYGMGLFLSVAAFRVAVVAVERGQAQMAALAGFLACAAAGSTLLTGSVAVVLLLWILFYSPAGTRLIRGAMFIAGGAVALLPVFLLLIRSPQQVIFDIFKYHMFFRRSDWPGATAHDMYVFISWIDFPQALILGSLAAIGVWFVAKKSGWDRVLRAEFYLCGWLALALGLYVSTAHPTFQQYYVFTIPFLAILASVGLFAAASRLNVQSVFWPTLAVMVLVLGGEAKTIYDGRDDLSWRDLEKLSAQVERVTPRNAPLYADEHIYFLGQRTPPHGNEYLSSHTLRLPPAQSAFQKIVPQPEFDRQIEAGAFATVETCEDEDWIKERNLTTLYRQKAEVESCTVFWDWAGGATAAPSK